jgi:hypothetical protein
MRTELGVVLRVYRPTAHCIHTAKRGRGCKEPTPLPTKNGRAPGIVCWGRLALTAVSLHLQFKCLARPGSHGETHLFDACCVTCLAALHMDRRAHMMERAACGRQDRRDRRCQASALSTARGHQQAGRVPSSGLTELPSCWATECKCKCTCTPSLNCSDGQSISDLALVVGHRVRIRQFDRFKLDSTSAWSTVEHNDNLPHPLRGAVADCQIASVLQSPLHGARSAHG